MFGNFGVGNGLLRNGMVDWIGFRHNFVIAHLMLFTHFYRLIELLLLLLLFLLASLQKLVGGLLSSDEIEMQSNQIEKQKTEHPHHQSSNPSQYDFGE